jgi:hypothetical protein
MPIRNARSYPALVLKKTTTLYNDLPQAGPAAGTGKLNPEVLDGIELKSGLYFSYADRISR